MANLTRDQILARKRGHGKATLPDGSTVGIRALTRGEILEMQDLETLAEKDDFILHKGLTDPELTMEEVAAWAEDANAGDLTAASDAIAELSGLKKGAGKSRVPRSGRRSRA